MGIEDKRIAVGNINEAATLMREEFYLKFGEKVEELCTIGAWRTEIVCTSETVITVVVETRPLADLHNSYPFV